MRWGRDGASGQHGLRTQPSGATDGRCAENAEKEDVEKVNEA